MSSSAHSIIRPLRGIGLPAACAAVLFAIACEKSGTSPGPGGGDDQEKPFLEISSEIPETTFSRSLRITGMARPGDTVWAFFAGEQASAPAAAEGFSLDLELPRTGRTPLSLFARGRGSATSDTLKYPLTVPGLQLYPLPPLPYANKDTFFLDLDVLGIDSASVRVNGSFLRLPIKPYPDLAIPLERNAMNHIVVRGLWKGGEVGDSLILDIRHDDIPPRLLGQSVYCGTDPARADSAIVLRFDDSIRVDKVTLGGNRGGYEYPFTVDRAGHRVLVKASVALGEILPMTAKLTDMAGNRLDTTFELRTYKHKVPLGTPISALLSSEREGIVYARAAGGGLLVIDTKAWLRIDSIPLPASSDQESGRRIVINPADKSIYLMMPLLKRIAVIDPFTKAQVDSLPIDGDFLYSSDIGLAFLADGTGYYFVDNGVRAMFRIDTRSGIRLSPCSLFTVANFSRGVSIRSFDSHRALLFAQGYAVNYEYSVLRQGDSAPLPVPIVRTDRSVEVLAASPYSDILLLTDKRLVDSRLKPVGQSLFDRDFQFGMDSRGREYMIRPGGGGLELDRFTTTGLRTVRYRGGGVFPVPGTDDVILLGYQDLVVLDLADFDAP